MNKGRVVASRLPDIESIFPISISFKHFSSLRGSRKHLFILDTNSATLALGCAPRDIFFPPSCAKHRHTWRQNSICCGAKSQYREIQRVYTANHIKG